MTGSHRKHEACRFLYFTTRLKFNKHLTNFSHIWFNSFILSKLSVKRLQVVFQFSCFFGPPCNYCMTSTRKYQFFGDPQFCRLVSDNNTIYSHSWQRGVSKGIFSFLSLCIKFFPRPFLTITHCQPFSRLLKHTEVLPQNFT